MHDGTMMEVLQRLAHLRDAHLSEMHITCAAAFGFPVCFTTQTYHTCTFVVAVCALLSNVRLENQPELWNDGIHRARPAGSPLLATWRCSLWLWVANSSYCVVSRSTACSESTYLDSSAGGSHTESMRIDAHEDAHEDAHVHAVSIDRMCMCMCMCMRMRMCTRSP